MDQFLQDGVQDFVFYQKDTEGRKTRKDKQKEKINKLKIDMENPILKKQRHEVRRNQAKAKLQKQLHGMNQQQAREYLDNKKEQKRITKERVTKALQTGMPILIDNVYEKDMNEKQNKSLAMQIQLIMKAVKHIDDPPGIHLCSVGGSLKTQLEKMKYNFWTLTSSTESIMETAHRMNKKPIYLSPDAEDELLEVQQDAAYIIGGLVDRTVRKNASLNRAHQLGIPAKCLPIRAFMKSRLCLNLDHVVMMLCKFKQTGDWKVAFEHGAPKRWKREQKNEGQGQRELEQKSEEQEEKDVNEESSENKK